MRRRKQAYRRELELHLEKMAEVAKPRIQLTGMSQCEAVGPAHGAMFLRVEPITTLVEVAAPAAPEMLVEMEAVAIHD